MDVITFARGNPTPDILPVDAFGECAQAVIAREGRTILNYGPPSGYGPLREWIAEQHGAADPAQVVITTGSLFGFNLVTRLVYADPGRAVVEAPSYDRTIGVLRSLGSTIEGVPLTDEGLDLDRLETILAEAEVPKLVYTIPTFQNPTGRTLSLDQRHALVELCRARGVLLFEDDPYRLVRYEGEPLPSMYELAAGKGVIFSSSFSKTGAPGLRVGYLIVPPEMVKPLESARGLVLHRAAAAQPGDLCTSSSRGASSSRTWSHVCTELKARRDAMLEALATELPEGAVVEPSRRRVLPLARPSRGSPRRRPLRAGRRGRRPVRQGHGFLRRRRGRRVGAAGFQLLLARRDPRRRAPSRRARSRRGSRRRVGGRSYPVVGPLSVGGGAPERRVQVRSASSNVATGTIARSSLACDCASRGVAGGDDEDVRARALRADRLLLRSRR